MCVYDIALEERLGGVHKRPSTANWTNPIMPSSNCEKNGFRSARKSLHGPVKKDKDINQLVLESEAHLSFQTLHHL